MKVDSEYREKNTYTFNKAELIETLIEAYEKKSGKILTNVNKKHCRIYANGKEALYIELVIEKHQSKGADYNGPHKKRQPYGGELVDAEELKK